MSRMPGILVVLCACTLLWNAALGAAPSSTTGTLAAAAVVPSPTPGKWQALWIQRVKEFTAENASLDPQKRTIVFLGDSLTQGFKLKTYFPGLPVLNRGIVSDGVSDFPSAINPWRGITQRMEESVFKCRPSHLFFLIGTNDVGAGYPLDYWFRAYKSVVDQTRQKFPDIKIILVTCPPSGKSYTRHENLNARVLEWNTMIRKYAAEQKFRLIDLHALLVGTDGLLPADLTRDGLHFNQIGYDRWAEAVRTILREDNLLPPSTTKP